jgi:hypothetical protein
MKIVYGNNAQANAQANAQKQAKKEAKAAKKKYNAWQQAVSNLPDPDFRGELLSMSQFYDQFYYPQSEFGYRSFDTTVKGGMAAAHPFTKQQVFEYNAGQLNERDLRKIYGSGGSKDVVAHAQDFAAAYGDYQALHSQTQQVVALEDRMQQQQALQTQEVQQLQEQQAQRVDAIRSAGATVANSLRILAAKPTSSAPTAQQTKQNKATAAKTTSPSASLRIGASGRSTGVGMNLGG